MNTYSLPKKIEKYLLNGEKQNVLYLLSKITALNDELLAETDEGYLRYAGQFRTQLLIDWQMYREALAWVCLESELYPKDMDAIVLKEQLKKKIVNAPLKEEDKFKVSPWKDIAGMYELKAIIEKDIIRPLKEKDLYKRFNVSIPNGFLFYGPPGCGKTYFARKVADRIGFNFIEIKPSDIGSTYVHGTQLEIKRLFDEARKSAPAVVFIDEIDAMVPSRQQGDISFHYKAEVNEFLSQLDKSQNEGIIIIGATNFLTNIDSAVLRPGRFDKKIFIGPPDLTARAEAFKLHLGTFPQEKLKYEIIAELSEFFTFAEIEFLCNEVKREGISLKTRINTDFVCKFITKFTPALNENEIDKYL